MPAILLTVLRVASVAFTSIGAWDLLNWFKPSSKAKETESFFTLERVLGLAGIGLSIYFLLREGKKRGYR